MSSAISAHGSLFVWNSQEIVELSSISGPGEAMDPIEVTSHESASEYREFVAGLRNGGDISIEGNLITGDSAGQIAMHTDFQAGTPRAFIIKFPGWGGGTPQISGTGLITAYSPSFPHDGKMAFSATIKVEGKPTLAV